MRPSDLEGLCQHDMVPGDRLEQADAGDPFHAEHVVRIDQQVQPADNQGKPGQAADPYEKETARIRHGACLLLTTAPAGELAWPRRALWLQLLADPPGRLGDAAHVRG